MNLQNQLLTDKSLNEFADYIEENLGFNFPLNSRQDLINKLPQIAKAFGFADSQQCVEWIMNSPLTERKVEILSHYLSIGETYFFRDTGIYEALRLNVLPEIIKRNSEKFRRIRIWSTACSTGEEPYSIAMLLTELIPNIRDWQISIIGSDINYHFLDIAKAGIYKPWSFRDVSKEVQEQYFNVVDKRQYAIKPEIKRMVSFIHHNLVDDTLAQNSQFSGFDLVLCNNVLIYFSEKTIKKVVTKLVDHLSPDGWLVVSAIEVPHVQSDKLKYIPFKNASFFKKSQDLVLKKILAPAVVEQKYVAVYPQNNVKQEKTVFDIQKLFEKGEYQEVVNYLESLDTEKKLTHALEMSLLAESYANLGKSDKARKWCETGLAIDKVNPALHFLHASILQEQQDYKAAIEALKRVMFLDPHFVLAHFELGNLMLKQDNKNEALKHYRNALNILKSWPPHAPVKGSTGLTAAKLFTIISQLKKQIEKTS